MFKSALGHFFFRQNFVYSKFTNRFCKMLGTFDSIGLCFRQKFLSIFSTTVVLKYLIRVANLAFPWPSLFFVLHVNRVARMSANV